MKPRKWKSFADQGTDPKGDITSGMGNGLIIQGYCLAVTEQPSFSFGSDPNLQALQGQCNATMQDAVKNANSYLDTMQPDCLTVLDKLLQFIRLQNTRIQEYTDGTLDRAGLASELQEIIDKRIPAFQTSANELVKNFTDLRPLIATNAGQFKDLAAKVSAAVNGDGGEIAKLREAIAGLDTKIKEMTAGSVLGALAIVGGSCLIAVGAASDVFTGGAATGVIVAGVAVAGAGVGVEVGSALSLAAALKAKNADLALINQLTTEVAQAAAMSSHLQLLDTHAEDAVAALQKVAAVWKTVGDSLSDIVEDVSSDAPDNDLEESLGDYKADINALSDSVNRVKSQFTGCTQSSDTGKSVDVLLTTWVNELPKAA